MSQLREVYFFKNQGFLKKSTAVIVLIMRIGFFKVTLSLGERGFSEWTHQ